MREFIVEISTTIRDGTAPAEVDRRCAAEAVRQGACDERTPRPPMAADR